MHRLAAAARSLPHVVDVVPGYRTVLLTVDDAKDLDAVRAALPGLRLPSPQASTGRLVELPVVYDGADLDEVARLALITGNDVTGGRGASTKDMRRMPSRRRRQRTGSGIKA